MKKIIAIAAAIVVPIAAVIAWMLRRGKAKPGTDSVSGPDAAGAS